MYFTSAYFNLSILMTMMMVVVVVVVVLSRH